MSVFDLATQPLHQGVTDEPGVWHTADVEGPTTALFITAGEGTTHRPRG